MNNGVPFCKLCEDSASIYLANGQIFVMIEDDKTGWYNIYQLDQETEDNRCHLIGDIECGSEAAFKCWIDEYLNYEDPKAQARVQHLINSLPEPTTAEVERMSSNELMYLVALLDEIDEEAAELTTTDENKINWRKYNNLSNIVYPPEAEAKRYIKVQSLINALPDASLIYPEEMSNVDILFIEALLDEVDEADLDFPGYAFGEKKVNWTRYSKLCWKLHSGRPEK